MRVFSTSVAVLVFLVAGAGQAADIFRFQNPPGPYQVGLQVVHQYGQARGWRGEIDPVSGKRNEGESARPVQTLVWYPATGSGKAMVYGDYLRLIGSEDDFTRSEQARNAVADGFVRRNYLSESGPAQGQAALAGPMRARQRRSRQRSFPGRDLRPQHQRAGHGKRRSVRIPGQPRLHRARQPQRRHTRARDGQ